MFTMKKLLFILFLALCKTISVAQPRPSVAGVTFGDNYISCKSKLDKRFNGDNNSYQLTANMLRYRDITFADEHFDYVEFKFQSNDKITYLSSITFVSSFDLEDADYAKKKRDRLLKLFSEKYEIRWDGINEDKFAYYVLGYNPRKKEDGFIVIDTYKGKNNGGETKCWTTLNYGPVNFINPSDEI